MLKNITAFLYQSASRLKGLVELIHLAPLSFSPAPASLYISILLRLPFCTFVDYKSLKWAKNVSCFLTRESATPLSITRTGNLTAESVTHFLHIPLSISALASTSSSYSNYLSLSSTTLPQRELVNYRMKTLHIGDTICFRSDKLDPIPHQHITEVGHRVLASLRDGGFYDYPNDEIVLRMNSVIERHIPHGARRGWKLRAQAIQSTRWFSGPLHGDLTPANIMMLHDKPLLIDLDRFRYCGPLFFDEMHYNLAIHQDITGRDYLASLSHLHPNHSADFVRRLLPSQIEPSKRSELILSYYFLLRIYFETKDRRKMPHSWRRRVANYSSSALER